MFDAAGVPDPSVIPFPTPLVFMVGVVVVIVGGLFIRAWEDKGRD